MGKSRHEELATTAWPAWAEMISRRRAAARPRLVRSRARKFFCPGEFFARKVKMILSPTKRKRRSPVAGVMVGLSGSTRNFYHEDGTAQSKRRDGCDQGKEDSPNWCELKAVLSG